ncbi:MAG: YbjN domain-containing protein [Chloroflexota bacterium]
MTGDTGNGRTPTGAARSLGSSASGIDAWLGELGIAPGGRAEREGVTSWDVTLDGRRRPAIAITLILDPALALLCWVHYAPPINESFRVSYRMLLRWNDELPFVKFAVSEDERPVLTLEIPVATLDRDSLGVALARLVCVCDLLFLDSRRWLEPPGARKGAWPPPPPGTPSPLLERFADRLGELATLSVAGAVDDIGAAGVADTLGRP